jgi:hypothetical protein
MIVNQLFSSVFLDSVNSYNARFPSTPSTLPPENTVTPTSDFEMYINCQGVQAFQLYYRGLQGSASISISTSQDPVLIGNASIANSISGKYIIISANDFPLNTCTNYQNALFLKQAHAQTYGNTNNVLEQGHTFTTASNGANIIEVYRTISPFYKISFSGVAGNPLSLSLLMVGDR